MRSMLADDGDEFSRMMIEECRENTNKVAKRSTFTHLQLQHPRQQLLDAVEGNIRGERCHYFNGVVGDRQTQAAFILLGNQTHLEELFDD